MSSSNDTVRCTVNDGELWMHIDNASVKIPAQLLEKSEVLTDALSVACPSVTRKVTLAAPEEWLQAWVSCYCNEEVSLGIKDITDLVNCLLVCFLLSIAATMVRRIVNYALRFTACLVLRSTLRFTDRRINPFLYSLR
jgi:hypothetical protein